MCTYIARKLISLFQIVKTDKIKAMSKKQLRQIKKTQVNRLGQVELVSPWADPKKKEGQKKEWVKRGKRKSG